MDDAEIPTTYTAAAAELDSILQRLERDDVDVDRLVADVARAAELLGWCRDRLARATVEIEHVVADLTVPDQP